MKKVVLSAALKTFAAAMSLLIIILSAFTIFAPLKLAKAVRQTGNYNLAASFTLIDYNRTKDINSLSQIVEYCVLADNKARIIKYSALLISHSKFRDYCQFKDRESQSSLSYSQYIYGAYVSALYYKNRKQEAFDTAKSAVPADYAENNAMNRLVLAAALEGDVQTGREIYTYLQGVYMEINGTKPDTPEREIQKRLLEDISILESYIEV